MKTITAPALRSDELRWSTGQLEQSLSIIMIMIMIMIMIGCVQSCQVWAGGEAGRQADDALHWEAE